MKKILIYGIIFVLFSLFFLLKIYKTPGKEIIKSPVSQKTLSITPTPQISPLTLEKIFFGDKTYLSSLPQDDLITIISTGDIIPARTVNYKATQLNDYTWSYKNVWPMLKNADLTIANLESPLMKNCSPTTEGMTFCGSDKNIEGLIMSGIDLVSLANNHIDNYGAEGVQETIKLLEKNNIKYTGRAETTYLTVKNLRLAFIGFNFLNEIPESEVLKQVGSAKKQADFIIVMPHWGEEYQEIPSLFETIMQKALVDAGADIIFGNHPHIIQPIYVGGGKFTSFAEGNFIFDQEWSENTKKGIVIKIYIYKGRVIDAEVTPILIKDYGEPNILEGEEKTSALNALYKLSIKYQGIEQTKTN